MACSPHRFPKATDEGPGNSRRGSGVISYFRNQGWFPYGKGMMVIPAHKKGQLKNLAALQIHFCCVRVNFFWQKPKQDTFFIQAVRQVQSHLTDTRKVCLSPESLGVCGWIFRVLFSKEDMFWVRPPPSKQSIGIQSYSQLMPGVSNHLLSILFRFDYHS